MRAPGVREALGSTLVRSRMWEQGMALEHLALRGSAVRGGANGSAVEALACEAGFFSSEGSSGGGNSSGSGAECAPSAALLPWMDTMHTQFVPQAWLNAYPLPIARQLLEVGVALPGQQGVPPVTPLHAPYAPGDWCISFSGCTAYFQQADCERLFREGAESAQRAFAEYSARGRPSASAAGAGAAAAATS